MLTSDRKQLLPASNKSANQRKQQKNQSINRTAPRLIFSRSIQPPNKINQSLLSSFKPNQFLAIHRSSLPPSVCRSSTSKDFENSPKPHTAPRLQLMHEKN
ncbi:hypothetical protein KC19_VG126300 [Ceratodon purpureus]|uniref:Uncharacterized protein n=1 Tax=Ceratodon purpureus TaxID=3225 RepID=A0A8T0HPT2_CERPU|nr:hypothetical protein KC19_VG126300 [Ceratodon purpureus]